MRGKKAKAIRRMIFGDRSIRARKYFRHQNGYIICDEWRRNYQDFKRVARGVRLK